MKGTFHLLIGVGFSMLMYLIVWLMFDWSDIFSLFFLGGFGSLFPDLDLALMPKQCHRHWLFHSAVIPCIIVVYAVGWEMSRFYDLFYLALGWGLHLLCDLKGNADGKIGAYLIFKWKGDRMSRRNTDFWLSSNALLCFAIMFISGVIVTKGLAG